MWEKKGKIRRTKSMTKKKVIRNFYSENGHFSWNWAAKNFFGSPQIRRQVSAHASPLSSIYCHAVHLQPTSISCKRNSSISTILSSWQLLQHQRGDVNGDDLEDRLPSDVLPLRSFGASVPTLPFVITGRILNTRAIINAFTQTYHVVQWQI